ncbi:MAG: hypothetical protein A2Y78_08565 [Acidobacteria bacterium RBG_13_68_16]|jgi:hypothetical protein|nr:MAG: hypothetical protein A2Y78_08565 [Acidobacteria bacterium RBG_13_68_16]
MAKRREIGAGNVGCVVSLAILVVAVLIAMKVIPTRVAVAELQDYCEKEAEQASLPRNSDQMIADRILIKAQENNLPVRKEDINVRRDGSMVHVEVKYRVILDLLVYKYNWDVEHKVDRTLF